jgi:hypothetical protein
MCVDLEGRPLSGKCRGNGANFEAGLEQLLRVAWEGRADYAEYLEWRDLGGPRCTQ